MDRENLYNVFSHFDASCAQTALFTFSHCEPGEEGAQRTTLSIEVSCLVEELIKIAALVGSYLNIYTKGEFAFNVINQIWNWQMGQATQSLQDLGKRGQPRQPFATKERPFFAGETINFVECFDD